MLKLTYYHARGCCDAIRLILVQSGMPYIEVNLTGTEFALIKPSLTFSILPILEDGDIILYHYNAITRHLARRFNLYGDALEAYALCDMWHDQCDMILQNLWHHDWEEDVTHTMKELKNAYFLREVKPHFVEMNEALSKVKKPFLVGDKLTYVDLVMKSMLDSLCRELAPSINVIRIISEEFILISLHYANISALPRIKFFCASNQRV